MGKSKEAVTNRFHKMDTQFYTDMLNKLLSCYQKCINGNGDYGDV